jgi:hypothetical protein
VVVAKLAHRVAEAGKNARERMNGLTDLDIVRGACSVPLTDAPRGCPWCGAVPAVGAHRLYLGAGLVPGVSRRLAV